MTLTDEDRALIDRVVKPYTALHALVVNYPEEVAALLSAARQARARIERQVDVEIVSEVLVTPDALQSLLHDAYVEGCRAVHENYQPDPDPDFTEAAYNYVAALDFTATTRPHRQARTQGPGEGFVVVPVEPTREMLKAAGDYADDCARLNYGGAPDAEGVWDAMLSAAPPASQIKEG